MGKKDGRDNLVPIEERSAEEVRAMQARGGVNSGKTRRRKADIKKTVSEVLNNSYTMKDGSTMTGAQAMVINLFKIATDPKNRQCIQATKLIFDLYGVRSQTKEEMRLINAQVELLEAKAKSVHAMEELNVEDLSPLAKLLDLRERTADREENDTN